MDGLVLPLLSNYFIECRRVAVAFSGGADSSFLTYIANAYGQNICAFCVKTEFQKASEMESAEEFCRKYGIPLVIIEYSIFEHPELISNCSDRCYHCKKVLLAHIVDTARKYGYDTVIDGTNASDSEDNRPGMRALKELGISSPLKICGITKDMVRELSKKAGLPTWDMPSESCLATRIPVGRIITAAELGKVERSEAFLKSAGFADVRVRIVSDGECIVQVPSEEFNKVNGSLDTIKQGLRSDFKKVALARRN